MTIHNSQEVTKIASKLLDKGYTDLAQEVLALWDDLYKAEDKGTDAVGSDIAKSYVDDILDKLTENASELVTGHDRDDKAIQLNEREVNDLARAIYENLISQLGRRKEDILAILEAASYDPTYLSKE